MKINTNNLGTGAVNGATPPAPRPASGTAQPATDGASFPKSVALNRALGEVPNSRPEVVERAKSLISDVNYPPLVIIRKLSALLAIHLNAATDESAPPPQ